MSVGRQSITGAPLTNNEFVGGSRKRPPFIADLNADPPESDGEDCAPPFPVSETSVRSNSDETSLAKNIVPIKDSDVNDGEDHDQQYQGVSTPREEKVCSLKAGLIHVARKMPKNAHTHVILGLMHQRLGQLQKAVLAFEKATEILQQEEIHRRDLLSLVQIQHAQCILQLNCSDNSDNELLKSELDGILKMLRDSVHLDIKQAAVWNTLGLMLLKTGRLQSAISVLSALLDLAPDNYDSLANLGIAYLQSGNIELSAKCLEDLVLKDQNHPASLINFAALLLCRYGSVIPGPGANGAEGVNAKEIMAANVAKDCLLTALKYDPKSGPLWINLANAYNLLSDYKNEKKCLEQAAKLEPHLMATRYAVAVHRVKDAERSQNFTQQIYWASNEMSSIMKEGDPALIDLPIARAGFAMAQSTHHKIKDAFETEEKELEEAKDGALYALKKAIEEDPSDAVHWHQLGLHSLCTMQFETSVKFLKAAVARNNKCSFTWSNLGIALQFSDDPSSPKKVFKHALSLATTHYVHAILSNLGCLYCQHRRFEHAKTVFTKSLELYPGYAPSLNNLGLVFVAESRWDDAIDCFRKALHSDPLLDAAMSNLTKAMFMCKIQKETNLPLQDTVKESIV